MTRFRLIAALGFGLVLAALAGANALGNVAQRRNPTLALRVSPADPVALMALAAQQQSGRGQSALPNAEEVALARRSLQYLALNGPALQVLGLADAANGRIARARAEVALSDRVTRRNVTTQLWLIEDAVQQGNVAGALTHYDVALRVSDGSGALLFPILSKALEDRALWSDFMPYIRAHSPWLGAYFRYAIRNSPRPDLVAALVTRSGGLPATEEFRGLGQELVGRLVETKFYPAAVRYYRTLPGARADVITTAALDPVSTDPRYAPLTWQPSVQSQINTSVLAVSAGPGNSLYSVVDPGIRGVIARKLMVLPPGTYRLRAKQKVTGAAERAELSWEMTCAASRTEIGSSTARLDETLRQVTATIVVPPGCPAQFLAITASGGSGSSAAEIVVEQVSVSRLNGG